MTMNQLVGPLDAPDPHPAWRDEVQALVRSINMSGSLLTDAEAERVSDRVSDLEALLATTPAHTAAGLRAQALLVLDALLEGRPNALALRAQRNVIEGLERLARAGRP